MGKKKKSESSDGFERIAQNRKARHRYHIEETFEAGLVLTGYEIKSIRNKGVSLNESYIRPRAGELWLMGAHITPYSHTQDRSVDPVRPRKLLLNKGEINKLQGRVNERGFTIVPLELYLKNGWAKLSIALAKGKSAPDKRAATKEKDAKRQAERAMKDAR